jgi:hypothetical protein
MISELDQFSLTSELPQKTIKLSMSGVGILPVLTP